MKLLLLTMMGVSTIVLYVCCKAAGDSEADARRIHAQWAQSKKRE